MAVAALVLPAFSRIPLQSVEASYGEHESQRLPAVIDGRDTGRVGWSVFPRTGESHSLIVRTARPVQAPFFDLTFCFLSGFPKRYFGSFALSYTTDTLPALNGKWTRATPEWFSATGTTLALSGEDRLVASQSDSMIGDAIFQVRIRAPVAAVTGFRVDVFPFERPDIPGPRVAWNEFKDFCLTELRVEAIQTTTTNVALGCKVTASHPLWANLSPNVLTDGLPGSFNHPADASLGASFHFEIDLGEERTLDHIALKSRADGYAGDRMSQLVVQLYGPKPAPGVKPVWEAMDRADGTHPGPGESDILRAADGKGSTFRGRFLRISSVSPVACSPQLAEVEAYGALTPRPTSIKVDGHAWPPGEPIDIPPGAAVLTVDLGVPGAGLPDRLPIRWRLRGLHDDWHVTENHVVEVADLSPGKYRFEAQVSHSDKEWDANVLAMPVIVQAQWWQSPVFYWSSSGAVLLASLWAFRSAVRRREARRLAALRYQSALAEERSRIARDMHDEVGARLSQLALMQDLLVRQHRLPDAVKENVREIATNTRQTVDALDHVVWAVNPLHDTLAGVAAYLSHTATSYLTPLNITCRLDMPFEWPGVEVRAQVRHQLILSFREALQNIVKHAHADTVTFSMSYDPPHLSLSLSDNGRGLPDEAAGIGKEGLNNMRSRLEEIGGTCAIQRRLEGGTRVDMRVPLNLNAN